MEVQYNIIFYLAMSRLMVEKQGFLFVN